jgi:hypothetical protein
VNEESRPARRLPDNDTAPSIADGAESIRQRPAPALVIRLELEQPARLFLAVANYDDELRLRSWLRRTRALEALSESVARLLDDLDSREAA